MLKQRRNLWLGALLVVVLIVVGCAPRASSGNIVAESGDSQLMVDLPALVIDVDDQGQLSMGNVPLAEVATMLPPEQLETLKVDPATVTFLTESNIQHVQIDNSPTGLIIMVNGKPIPSIRWDGGILTNTGSLVSQLGAGVPVLDRLLPLLAQMGIGVIVRFPLAQGAEPIPLSSPGDDEAAVAAQKAQETFLESVGENAPTIRLPVYYDTDGSWRVGNLTDSEWSSLTGLPVFQAARLEPRMVQQMMDAGIATIGISTDASGIHMSINGSDLPYIGWGDGEVTNLIALVDEMGLLEGMEGAPMDIAQIVGVVETVLPIVQATNTDINVFFPSGVASTN